MNTTKSDFALFLKEVRFWEEALGLKEWRIDIFHMDDPEMKDSRAWFFCKEGYIAGIALSKNWGDDVVTKERIKEAALHEILHVVFAEISWAANERFIPKGVIEAEEHKIIRRFESCFSGIRKS